MFVIQNLRILILRGNRYFLRRIIRSFNRLLKLSEKNSLNVIQEMSSGIEQNKLVISASKYDMFTSPGEDYYSEQYWQLIQDFMPDRDNKINLLDLGTGQGRMVQKFLENFPRVEIKCCDISEIAINNLKVNVAISANQKIDAVVSGYASYIETIDSSSIDIILFTEVSFYSPGWEKILLEIRRVLRPGGLFISSHRSRYFNAMALLSLGHIKAAAQILEKNTGRLFGTSNLQFSWNDSASIRDLVEGAGFVVLKVAGLGVLSGIKGDPHEFLAEPGILPQDDLQALMKLEKQASEVVPDVGRYIIFVARKA